MSSINTESLKYELQRIWQKNRSIPVLLKYLADKGYNVEKEDPPRTLKGYGIVIARIPVEGGKVIIAISPNGTIRVFKRTSNNFNVEDPEDFLKKLGVQL